MYPTNKLRFVQRAVPAPEHGENYSKTERVLQQWWQMSVASDVYVYEPAGEWRDVPLEIENESDSN